MRSQHLVTALLSVVMLTPAVASAQARVEVSGFGGWTISDGVAGDGVRALDGNIYNAIDIKDSFSWGFGVGFNVSETTEVGFLFNQQMSTLGVEGTNTVEIGDLNVTSYHPYFAYNFGEQDAAVRPFILVGLGATSYGSVPFTRSGFSGETGGDTQFSTTWARRREVLRFAERRRAHLGDVDADLHHQRSRRNVVRSVLGLLRGRRLQVRTPVPLERRHHVPVLKRSEEVRNPDHCPPSGGPGGSGNRDRGRPPHEADADRGAFAFGFSRYRVMSRADWR